MRSTLRNILPAFIYKIIYLLYHKTLARDLDQDFYNKVANFNKKDFYKFSFANTEFDILLNPENGGVDELIYVQGYMEYDVLTLMKNVLNKNTVFVDVGANIGQHSLFASRFADSVIAFEPIKSLFSQFQMSVDRNKFNNIHIMNHALGNVEEEIKINITGRNMGTSSILVKEEREEGEYISVKRFDDIFTKIIPEDIKEKKFVFKIDVEGYEYQVLLGMQDFLKRFNPEMIVEYSPYLYSKVDVSIGDNILSLLSANDYKVDIIKDDGSRELMEDLSLLNQYHQVNIFCYK